MQRNYTDEQLIEAVKTSISVNQALRKVGITSISGGMHSSFKKNAKRLGCDLSHFTGQYNREVSPNPNKKSLEELLIDGSNYNRHLKNRLVKEKLLEYKCKECDIKEWRGKPLALHLDHISGDNTDNRIENLRLLCPNCHSQTETYCRGLRRKQEFFCMDCGDKVSAKGIKRCVPCQKKEQFNTAKLKIVWPDTDVLFEMASKTSYAEVARSLGVTANTLRKRLTKRGFNTKKRKRE